MIPLDGVPPQPTDICRWFVLCENEATSHRPHPILGPVPICDRCDDKIQRFDDHLAERRATR